MYLCIPVNGPGPDRQLAEVGSGGVHDGLVHVVPERQTDRLQAALQLTAHEERSAKLDL